MARLWGNGMAAGVGGLLTAALVAATPGASVSVNGYLDSDVWTDLRGRFFTNDELDLATTVAFGDSGAVKAHVCATVRGGAIPAGTGEPGNRWVSVLFDGVDIEFGTRAGTFTVGDLVYQYGKFNYYFYKRRSMITEECFTRGLRWAYTGGRFRQELLVGAADVPDEILGYQYVVQGAAVGDTLAVATMETLAREGNAADLGGASTIEFSEGVTLGVFYGARADIAAGVEQTGLAYGGLEFRAAFGEILKVKADAGYRSLPGASRSSLFSLLLEPSLALGKFSLALSYYQVIDPDKTGASLVGEDMFVYMEPGVAFSPKLAAGLPLEVHANGPVSGLGEAGAFWAVPTFYVYPCDGVQWWIWGQVVAPFGGDKMGYGLGSELIVEF